MARATHTTGVLPLTTPCLPGRVRLGKSIEARFRTFEQTALDHRASGDLEPMDVVLRVGEPATLDQVVPKVAELDRGPIRKSAQTCQDCLSKTRGVGLRKLERQVGVAVVGPPRRLSELLLEAEQRPPLLLLGLTFLDFLLKPHDVRFGFLRRHTREQTLDAIEDGGFLGHGESKIASLGVAITGTSRPVTT